MSECGVAIAIEGTRRPSGVSGSAETSKSACVPAAAETIAVQPGGREPVVRDRGAIMPHVVDQAAAIVTRAVERERREVTGPFIYSLFHQFGRLFPRFVHWCVCFGGASRRSRR
jgi:hypothetical protein